MALSGTTTPQNYPGTDGETVTAGRAANGLGAATLPAGPRKKLKPTKASNVPAKGSISSGTGSGRKKRAVLERPSFPEQEINSFVVVPENLMLWCVPKLRPTKI